MEMKVLVAYSGGLDTSVIVKWVKETYNCEVVAYCADVGQEEETDGLDEKARKTGALKCIVDDLNEEFAQDFIFPMMQANAIYEGTYLLGTSIARPLIGKRLVEVAREEGCDAICHGATGKGNDQVRFELAAYALDPKVKIIAAWRDPNWTFKARTEMIDYANKHNIPITSTAAKPYSMDRNLLHISFEGGILEDPWNAPKDDMYCLTKPLMEAADDPEDVVITFEKGIPVAVNGEKLSPANIMRRLNKLGARHAVGRIDIVENRFVGMKSRGVYETPGGTILHHAHRALESITMDKELLQILKNLKQGTDIHCYLIETTARGFDYEIVELEANTQLLSLDEYNQRNKSNNLGGVIFCAVFTLLSSAATYLFAFSYKIYKDKLKKKISRNTSETRPS